MISTVVQSIGSNSCAMHGDCFAYDKEVVQCIGIKSLVISIVVKCIGIALFMISIGVQCIGINCI